MASNPRRRRDFRLVEGYGDPHYKGKGILKCRICGDPLRDHDLFAASCTRPAVARVQAVKPEKRKVTK